MKKRIGISFTRTNFQNYWNWFTKEDLENNVELIELSFIKNNMKDISTCDGFILTGGIDIDPAFYKGASSYVNQPSSFEPERDKFEKTIYEYSQQHHRPLLGICRGLQLVNVLQGGKLVQDLGAGNSIHRKETGTDKQHKVVAQENTLLHEITASTITEINSAHHQAISATAIGDNLQVNSYSENDGTIEGIEFKNKEGKAFMLCVQWHPERMKEKERNPFSQNLKERFLQEVKKINKHEDH